MTLYDLSGRTVAGLSSAQARLAPHQGDRLVLPGLSS